MSESTSPQSNISPSSGLHTGSPVPSSPVIHSFDITDRAFQPTSPSRLVRGSPGSQPNVYIMAPPPLPITVHTTSQGMQTDTIESQKPPEFNNSEMITDQGVQTDTMQTHNPPEFHTEITTNGIDSHTTEIGYDNEHQGMANQVMAYQEMADQEMGDQEMADKEMADQEMANQEMADQEMADQEMADLVMELQDHEMEDQ
jgi:hypothetical protein